MSSYVPLKHAKNAVSCLRACSGYGDELDFTGFREWNMSGGAHMQHMRSKYTESRLYDLVVGLIFGSDAATSNFNWTEVCSGYRTIFRVLHGPFFMQTIA